MELIISANDVIIENSILLENKVTVIFGDNGSGKTSLLKNIYINEDNQKKLREEKLNFIFIPIWRVNHNSISLNFSSINKDYDFIDINLFEKVDRFNSLENYIDYNSKTLSYIKEFKVLKQEIEEILNDLIEKSDLKLDNFQKHSDGYKSIIMIICNILYESIIQDYNKPLDEICNKISGFILIDEIDCFLYQKVQFKIIGFLTKIFPNANFLITTHSPVILKTLFNSNKLLKIMNKRLEPQPINYFKDLDLIIRESFDINFTEGIPDEIMIFIKDLVNNPFKIKKIKTKEKNKFLPMLKELVQSQKINKFNKMQKDWIQYIIKVLGDIK